MFRQLCKSCVVSVCFGWLLAGAVRADEGDEEALFQKVMTRLLNSDLVIKDYPKKYAYPPRYFVKANSEREVNAYASASKVHGAAEDEKSGKLRPVVMMTQGMLKKLIEGDENSLAVIMGHELAHLSKDHVAGLKSDTALLALAFNREQELEADLNGMRFAVAAGYPYKLGVAKAIQIMREKTKFSSFEGLGASHPTWEERLIFLDREQAQLWSAMSAFQNGYLFLELEQHLAAQQCFKAVVAEFPDCYEAWANLGYSQLMHYCDGLETDDLKQYGIGQIVAGGFYSRPQSLESKVRGIDEKLWQDAVKALTKALALKPDLVLPRASLGVAYLVHPEGKQVKKASQFFNEALDNLKNDAELQKNPLSMAALLMNSGVADLARGDVEGTDKKFKAVATLAMRAPPTPLVKSLHEALAYNQALLEARSPDMDKKRKACKRLEDYLGEASPDSAWWSLAYERYAKLSKEADSPAWSKGEMARRKEPTLMRVVVSIAVGADSIALSEPVKAAVDRLGKDAVATPLFPGSKIARWRSLERGIDLLGKDKVLAIFLTNSKAPAVTLRATGVGGKATELRVGMDEKEGREILKDQRAEKGQHFIADSKVGFRFYPELGLAIRFDNDRVDQLAIAQIPRRSFMGK